ncbi:hypothetical protein CIRMBP1307_00343 [Enterococcus cecorum]|uniref:hypothetical protein n=1 Tax=Enterococcus cecorum TaxID=44008 RepID=UPI000AE24221|nr:hypothetical protein [Enterococcus cecorum]CAI3338187.1 hypothetical protein CIRMBP1307_00343 [Enterococcus cecorum]
MKKNIYMFRIILFGWMMFGLGLLSSGNFSGKLAIIFSIASVVILLAYDAAFDKYLKGGR